MIQPTARRPAAPGSFATRRPAGTAPTRRPTTTVTPTTRRPATATAARPVTTTHATTVRRPATTARKPTITTRRPGITTVTHTRRTGTHPQPHHTGTTRKHVTGWPHHHKHLHPHAHPAGTTTHHTRRHPGATTVIHHGRPVTTTHTTGRPVSYVPGRRNVSYVPGSSTVYYTPGEPMYSQPVPAASPGAYMPGAPIPTRAPMPSGQPASTTASCKPCSSCGTSTRGCTTLSRFAFNSAELTSSHKAQLRQLAERILRHDSNAVIATGHTDSSGTEDYNEVLGEKRSATVVKELQKQLALLKPGSQQRLFWKTHSKGETRPVSTTDAAANRRVSICVKKAHFSK